MESELPVRAKSAPTNSNSSNNNNIVAPASDDVEMQGEAGAATCGVINLPLSILCLSYLCPSYHNLFSLYPSYQYPYTNSMLALEEAQSRQAAQSHVHRHNSVQLGAEVRRRHPPCASVPRERTMPPDRHMSNYEHKSRVQLGEADTPLLEYGEWSKELRHGLWELSKATVGDAPYAIRM